MGRICLSTVQALFTETRALPNQVIDSALQLGYAFLEFLHGRTGCHESLQKLFAHVNPRAEDRIQIACSPLGFGACDQLSSYRVNLALAKAGFEML